MAKAVIIDYTYLGGEELFTPERQACAESGIDLELRSCKTEDEIIEAAHDADAVLCCGNPPITRKVIEALPQCRAYIRYGIGVNSVDLDAATEHGKLVYFMPGFCAEELVLHATALVLNLLRNVCFYDREIRAGKWPKAKGALPRRLTNMTVGLYGFGASARPMAKVFGHGFGSRVIACDPYLPDSVFEEAGVARVSFDELLAQADIVSIHAPLTAENRHIFNMDAFRKMKSTAMIINIARGPLIDEADLIEALKTGEIRYAGLDTHEHEPLLPGDPLLELENVVVTPHSAFYGEESLHTQHVTAARLTVSTLKDHEIVQSNLANRKVLEKL